MSRIQLQPSAVSRELHRLSILVPRDQYIQLVAAAEAAGITVSDAVRQLIGMLAPVDTGESDSPQVERESDR